MKTLQDAYRAWPFLLLTAFLGGSAVWLYNLRSPRPIPVAASMHEESNGARAAQATRAALGEPGNEGASGVEIELASDLWGPSRIVIESPTEELA